MDARQIAALARAGLTDDQIDTVVRVTAAPKPEAQTSSEPLVLTTEAQATSARKYVGKRAYFGRTPGARQMALAELKTGPRTVKDIARVVYGCTLRNEMKNAERLVWHLVKAGLVELHDGRVRLTR